jgi:hypothetical protein
MNRRAFFALLAGGLTLDPEKLLGVPGPRVSVGRVAANA